MTSPDSTSTTTPPADTTSSTSSTSTTSAAPAVKVGDVVAVDSFDSYAGREVTDVFQVVHTTDLPDEGPRVVLAHLGNLSQLANLPAGAVRSL